MVTIISRPVRTVDEIVSRWTASHNPVIYKFSRIDRNITAVIEAGGFLRLTLDDATGLEIGQSGYMNTSKYKGGVVIENISGSFIYVSGLTLNGSDTVGYFNEVKRNYRIEINIREAGNNKLLGSTSCVPFTDGKGQKDLSSYVSAYLKLINAFGYDVVNERDINASIKFYITYQEKWLGGSGDLVSDNAQPVYAVNAAKQIGDINGQNMAEYVLVYPSTRLAKWLTKFRRPVYFEGLPFSISFVHSEQLAVQITKKERHLNVNQSQVDEGSESLDIEQRESVNRLMLAGGYASTVKFIGLQLVSGAPAEPGYVYTGYVEEGYVAQL